MKSHLARLLFRYLSRMGLVLCVADPEAPIASEPAAAAPGDVVDHAASTDGGDDSQPEGDTPADPDKPKGDAPQDERDKLIRKLERRIGTRTKALGHRDAIIESLTAEVQRLRAGGAMPSGSDEGEDDHDEARTRGTKVDPEKRARELAAEMVEHQTIAQRTRAMLKAGEQFPNFREVANDVAEVLPFVDEQGKPTAFIRAVLEADNPAALLQHIGTDDDVLESLAGLSPSQLGYRLGTIAAKLGGTKPPEPRRSNAPTPLTPVAGRGDTNRNETTMTDEEWRAARILARKKAA